MKQSATQILTGMRPRQWAKNLFVFAPLVFALRLADVRDCSVALLTFFCFCLASGATYLLNDILDRDSDALHPVKRLRPIASGALSIKAASTASGVAAVGAMIGGFVINWQCGVLLAVYLVMNLVYSFWGKRVPVVDLLFISSGFLLRVSTGALAIAVPISSWILICTFLVSLYLGFGKRYHELLTLGREADRTRPVLRAYNVAHTRLAVGFLGLACCAAFVAYTLSAHAQLNFGTVNLIFTAPLAGIGLYGYARLAADPSRQSSPTDALLSDPLVLASGTLWFVATILILYWARS